MFDQLRDVAAQEVERLEAALPDTIMAIDGRVSALSERSLADVEAAYRGSVSAATPCVNAELAELLTYVRSEAAACVLNLRKIERFIALHVPKVEDGNNFGVAIQMETNKMVQAQGAAVKALLDKLPDYHKDRAAAWKGVSPTRATETVESQSSSVDEATPAKEGEPGKTTKAGTGTTTKTTTSTPEPLADAVAHVVALDVNGFFSALFALEVVRDAYIQCGDALAKNKEKLAAPKGEGGNAMSMF